MSYLDELADSIAKKTEDFGKKAANLYEGQKLKGKILSEEHMVKKLKGDIGNLIYEKYKEGIEVDESLKGFCEEITQHMQIIAGYRANAASLRDEKICPGCEKAVDISVAYCPYCGTPCPTPEPKEEEKDAEVPEEEGQEESPEKTEEAESENAESEEMTEAPEEDKEESPEKSEGAEPEETAEVSEESAEEESKEEEVCEEETSEAGAETTVPEENHSGNAVVLEKEQAAE